MLEQKKNRWDGETRCRAPRSRRGGCRPRGSEESAPLAWRPKPAASRHVGEEQGTGDSLPAALDRRSHRRPPGGGGAAGRPPNDVQYHRMAPASEPLSWLRDRAAVCPGTGPRFFFPLSLSLLCHSSSFRLLFSRLVCPYPQERRGRPYGLPPGEGGGGEYSAVSWVPPVCEGLWGYVASGAGPRAVGTERGRWSIW